MLGAWRVVDDRLIVDWQRTLTAGRMGRLTVRLASRNRESSAASDSIAVPDLVPLGSTQRAGSVSIKTPPNVRALGESASAAPPPTEERESSPWGSTEPDLILPLTSGNRIQLQPRASGFECQANCRISPADDSVAVIYRLHIEPRETAVPNLLLRCPGGCDSPGDWRVVQGRAAIRSVDRVGWQTDLLALAATRSIWSSVAAAAFQGEWLRIFFASPVAEPFDLECRSTLRSFQVLLFEVIGSSESAWQTSIDSASGPQWDVRSASGRPLWRTSDANGGRSFRSEPAVLTVFSRPAIPPILNDVRLTVDASQPGSLSHALQLLGTRRTAGETAADSAGRLPQRGDRNRWHRRCCGASQGGGWPPADQSAGRHPGSLDRRDSIHDFGPRRRVGGQFVGPTADRRLRPAAACAEWILPAAWIPARPESFVEMAPLASTSGNAAGSSRWVATDIAAVPGYRDHSSVGNSAIVLGHCSTDDRVLLARCGSLRRSNRRGRWCSSGVHGHLAACAVAAVAAPLGACAFLILRPHLAEARHHPVSFVGRSRLGSATALGLLTLAGWITMSGVAAARSDDSIYYTAVPNSRTAMTMPLGGQDRHPNRPRKPVVAEMEFRMATVDYWSVETGEGAWVHQLTGLVDAPAPVSIALIWPQAVEVLNFAVDDETLVLSGNPRDRLVAPLDRHRLNGTLVCVWRTQEDRGKVRSSLPRIESAKQMMTLDAANWRILPLPGRTVAGAQASSLDTGRSDPRSTAARLQIVDRFVDQSRPVWSVNGHPSAVTIVHAASAIQSASAIRTGLLFALLTAVAAFSWFVRPLEALETVAAVALVAAIVAWEWPWLLAAAFLASLRAANAVFSWRFAPRSAA